MAKRHSAEAWRATVSTPAQKLVLVRLAMAANAGGQVKIGFQRLAEECSMDETAAKYAIVDLMYFGRLRNVKDQGTWFSAEIQA